MTYFCMIGNVRITIVEVIKYTTLESIVFAALAQQGAKKPAQAPAILNGLRAAKRIVANVVPLTLTANPTWARCGANRGTSTQYVGRMIPINNGTNGEIMT